MNARPKKILALQFKYFGDAVLMTPALRALRSHFPDAELHVLVAAEIAPLFRHLPWLHRVWALPRQRGHARLGQTWPLIRALRREKFDGSVDFVTNDRGAILSLLTGAKNRLGWDVRGGFFGRKFCYTQRVTFAGYPHESERLCRLLSGWNIPMPASLESEIRPDPALADAAKKILPEDETILCHVAASQPKKEWPLAHWAKFHRLARAAGMKIVFTTAKGERETALTRELSVLAPDAAILPPIPELPLFLAVLARAKIFVSVDTGPLHFAAGLGVPTISLFGPTPTTRWAPAGAQHRFLTGEKCDCSSHTADCLAVRHCLAAISPERVFEAVNEAAKKATAVL